LNNPLTHDKTKLRNEAKQRRSLLDLTSINTCIQENVMQWAEFHVTQVVLSFMPLAGEIDLTGLITHYPNKQWFLPKTYSNGTLEFFRYSEGDRLEQNSFGIREPLSSAVPLNVKEVIVDLVIVPALLLDHQGTRLGFGKGYYDRFLSSLPWPVTTLCPIPECLFVENLPTDPWDVPIQWAVTENGILKLPIV
jgi:5-formyltetrahydrofolate cyclo-ligase